MSSASRHFVRPVLLIARMTSCNVSTLVPSATERRTLMGTLTAFACLETRDKYCNTFWRPDAFRSPVDATAHSSSRPFVGTLTTGESLSDSIGIGVRGTATALGRRANHHPIIQPHPKYTAATSTSDRSVLSMDHIFFTVLVTEDTDEKCAPTLSMQMHPSEYNHPIGQTEGQAKGSSILDPRHVDPDSQ